jgi:hypothetical protein
MSVMRPSRSTPVAINIGIRTHYQRSVFVVSTVRRKRQNVSTPILVVLNRVSMSIVSNLPQLDLILFHCIPYIALVSFSNTDHMVCGHAMRGRQN